MTSTCSEDLALPWSLVIGLVQLLRKRKCGLSSTKAQSWNPQWSASHSSLLLIWNRLLTASEEALSSCWQSQPLQGNESLSVQIMSVGSYLTRCKATQTSAIGQTWAFWELHLHALRRQTALPCSHCGNSYGSRCNLNGRCELVKGDVLSGIEVLQPMYHWAV